MARIAVVLALGAGMSAAAHGGIIDNLNDSSQIVTWNKQPYDVTTVAVNANGTLTVTRTVTGRTTADSGIHWHNANPIPLTADYDSLTLTPAGTTDSGAAYMATIVYVAAPGQTIAAGQNTWSWIPSWTSSTAVKTLDSVMAHAPTGAGSYYLMLRVLPVPGATDTAVVSKSFTFDSIAAVPEPASCALLGLGGLLLARRRKA